MTVTPPPTLAGFQAFVQNTMGISSGTLDPSSDVVSTAFQVAQEIVNEQLNNMSATIYTLAVYNLAGDNLVNYAQDTAPSTYFADLRKSFGMNSFVGGVIQSTGDEGTSESMVVPEAAKEFTLANLQQLKTPWGRQYLAFAQSYGPIVWGIT